MAKRNGQWISVRADNRIMNGLVQCWQRTKAKSFKILKRHLISKEIFQTILFMQMLKETLLTGMAIVFLKEIQNMIGVKLLMELYLQQNGKVITASMKQFKV